MTKKDKLEVYNTTDYSLDNTIELDLEKSDTREPIEILNI